MHLLPSEHPPELVEQGGGVAVEDRAVEGCGHEDGDRNRQSARSPGDGAAWGRRGSSRARGCALLPVHLETELREGRSGRTRADWNGIRTLPVRLACGAGCE